MHYYQFNIGDYTSQTRGLSLMEDLAYRRLIDECYINERPLDPSPARVARFLGMTEEKKSVKYVLEQFFDLTDEGWVHRRIDREIEDFRQAKSTKSKAGKASAAKRKMESAKQDNGSVDTETVNSEKEDQHNPTGVEQVLDSVATQNQQKPTGVEQVLDSVQLTNNQEPLTNNHKPIYLLGDSSEPPPSEKNLPDQTVQPKKPKPASRRRKLPDDFLLTEERDSAAQTYWLGRGRTDLDARVEFEKFQNHHRQHGKTMACWESAWKTWYANAVDFNKAPIPSVIEAGTRDRTLTQDLTDTSW